jgi:integrase
MALSRITKRSVDALDPPTSGQLFLWDTDIKGFGVRAGATGTKSFVIQYANADGRIRRSKIGRYGVLTVDQARELAKIRLGQVATGRDPAEEVREARKSITVGELCDWYLTEARAGRILGRRMRPIKTSSLDMDDSRIRTHIKPLLGRRPARGLTVADVETMQSDIAMGKTARARVSGRGGRAAGGSGVAARCVGTLQAMLAHAKHKGLIPEHPTQGARKLAGVKRTRRLSRDEIHLLGKAMALAEHNGENSTALAVLRVLILTGFRREEAQAMQRAWVNGPDGYVAFPDTKSGAQLRVIGSSALKVIAAQPEVVGNPHVFPSTIGDGPYTAVSACLARLCRMAKIEGVTAHTLRHTFGSMAGELGFSELTIRAMLGHASQNVTQDYVHIDEAVTLAVERTSGEIERLLSEGAKELKNQTSPVG